jgi:hypothetical protein
VRRSPLVLGLFAVFAGVGVNDVNAQERPRYQDLERAGYRYVAKDQPGYVPWCAWIYVRRCSDPVYSCDCGGMSTQYGRCSISSPRSARHYRGYCQG